FIIELIPIHLFIKLWCHKLLHITMLNIIIIIMKIIVCVLKSVLRINFNFIYLDQQLNFDSNDIKYDPQQYSSGHHQHLQVSNSQFPQQQPYFDLNNNNNYYSNGRTNMFYPLTQQGQSIPQQTLMSSNNNHTYTQLGSRYSGGINN